MFNGKRPRKNFYEGTIEKKKRNKTILCYAYEEDLNQIYSFYCARYKDMSFKEFLNLGINEVRRKLDSIPEDEPLYKIIKSRTIKPSSIKDKNERKYWEQLKKANQIPSIYITDEETENELKERVGKNGNKFKGIQK